MDSREVEARKQRAFDIKRVRAFQELIRTEGWQLYVALLNGKIEMLTSNLFERPVDDNLRGEAHDRGHCYGVLWARDLPSATIAAMDHLVEDSVQEENE